LLILGATDDWQARKFLGFKALSETHPGLGEMRFHIQALAPGAARPYRRRFRPVGIWPTWNIKEFIFILGCEKRGRQLIPHDAFGVALTHRARLEEGRGSIRERI